MIHPIAPQELARLVEAGREDPDVPGGKIHVWDVRDAEAFVRGHVPGARHAPLGQALRWIPQRVLTHELIVLVDEKGEPHGPARHLASELTHHWFRRLRYLEGGFAAWQGAGLPMEEGGPAGETAGIHDGETEEFHRSRPARWREPQADPPLPTPELLGWERDEA